jgi:hypothetical protein
MSCPASPKVSAAGIAEAEARGWDLRKVSPPRPHHQASWPFLGGLPGAAEPPYPPAMRPSTSLEASIRGCPAR